jgi:hypothetical protein
MSYFMQHEYLKQDQENLQYLKDIHYFRPDGCLERWDGKSTISSECAPNRYWIKSNVVSAQFKLPPRWEETDDWFRIGRDAFDLKCWGNSCTVVSVIPSVFGK